MATFTFELVSPERILFSGDAVSVIVPSVEGEMTVLAGHAPLVAVLKPGIVLVQTGASNGKEFFVSGGLVDVMLALVASIHVLNTALREGRRGWSGQARP
jgi:F-type H+-transporting ATPase subunit epsilon